MPNIIDNLNGYFIGTVVGYDTSTRELDVFIPKLMPNIADGRKDVSIKTNLGNNKINIKHNENLIISSSIKVKAEDKDESIPEIGSKVMIYFLDERFELGYWYKFNVNGDYNVIEDEKYKLLNTFYINDSFNEVYEEDTISIELPEGFSVVNEINPFGNDKKIKKIKIEKDKITEKRVSELEELVGTPGKVQVIENDNGEEKELQVEASGIFKELSKRDEALSMINFKLGCDGKKTVYKKIIFEKYEPGKEYFMYNGEEFTRTPAEDYVTVEEKTNVLKTLQNENGYELFEKTEEDAEPTGIYGELFLLRDLVKSMYEEIKELKTRIDDLESN